MKEAVNMKRMTGVEKVKLLQADWERSYKNGIVKSVAECMIAERRAQSLLIIAFVIL